MTIIVENTIRAELGLPKKGQNMTLPEMETKFANMKAFREQLAVDEMVFPAYLKEEQEEYNIYWKISSRETGLRVECGITPLLHDSEIRAVAEKSLKGLAKECSEDEFLEAQVKAQLRINKLLIK